MDLSSDQQRGGVIARCSLFDGIGKQLLVSLARAAIEVHVRPNRTIAPQGEPFPFLGIVAEGSVVAIISSREGREQILYESAPGQTFAEVPSLDGLETLWRFAGGAHGASCLEVPRPMLEEVLGSSAEFGLRLARILSSRARLLVERLVHLAFETTLERTIRAIRSHIPREADGWIDAPADLQGLSQTQLAEITGTVRIVVARDLRTLVEARAIELERGRIKRINAAVLHAGAPIGRRRYR